VNWEPDSVAISVVLTLIGVIALGMGALELHLYLRPAWALGLRRGQRPTVLGVLLWLALGLGMLFMAYKLLAEANP
jgi:predicted lysophospholipase L1 biosynthesis ABC-type transport system permease subunit